MQFERGRNYERSYYGMDLTQNCVNRKLELEKILFAYNNLHLLDPWYSENALKAFSSEEQALWSFENRVILNSKDVENLMSNQATSQGFNPYSDPINLVCTLDSAYQAPHGSMIMSSQGECFPTYQQQQYPPSQGPPCQAPYGFPPDFSVPPPPLFMPSPCPPSSIPSEYSSSSHYGPSMPNNSPDLVFDVNGLAYKRMNITSMCLVPVTPQQSSACSSYSLSSSQNEQIYYQESEPQHYTEESVHMDSQIGIYCDEQESQKPPEITQVSQRAVEENQSTDEVIEMKSPVSKDMETEYKGMLNSLELNQSLSEITLSTSPVTEDSNCVLPSVESQWNESHPPLETSALLQLNDDLSTPPSMSSVINQVVHKTEAEANDGDDTLRLNYKSSSNEKKKLTKKEKRLLAAERMKQLETDDIILEEAIKANKEYGCLAESIGLEVLLPANRDKKRKRTKTNTPVESVPSLQQPSPTVSPHIMHAVKMAVLKRAEQLRQRGREIGSDNPILNDYLEKVTEFENKNQLDRKDTSTAKQFIMKRIQAFKAISKPQCRSRITIYEHMYTGLPRVFLPELCFLNSIINDPKFETYEEVFFHLF